MSDNTKLFDDYISDKKDCLVLLGELVQFYLLDFDLGSIFYDIKLFIGNREGS